MLTINEILKDAYKIVLRFKAMISSIQHRTKTTTTTTTTKWAVYVCVCLGVWVCTSEENLGLLCVKQSMAGNYYYYHYLKKKKKFFSFISVFCSLCRPLCAILSLYLYFLIRVCVWVCECVCVCVWVSECVGINWDKWKIWEAYYLWRRCWVACLWGWGWIRGL